MTPQDLDGAVVSIPSAFPRHRAASSITRNPDSPRNDKFKRMSMASISSPRSETSTRPNSMITAYTEEPSEISSPVSRNSMCLDTNPYLTAVAAQERRVLELREELQKAEAELQSLKKSWAQQEAARKRQEIKQHAEAMRPLTSPTKSASGTPTVEGFRQSLDDERKRALYARPRIPERRVFEGRHTRALSLLSPGTLANRPIIESSTNELGAHTPNAPVLRQDTDGARDETHDKRRTDAESKPARDDIVNTSKQLVGDIREGFWSFWDDLRQATVGEEALQELPTRRPSHQGKLGRPNGPSRKSSSSTLQKPPSRRTSRSPHTRSNTVAGTISATSNTPARAAPKTRRLETTSEGSMLKMDGEDDGGWSNWDSPAAKTVGSRTDTANSASSTPRTSVSSNEETPRPKHTAQSSDSALSNSSVHSLEHEPSPSSDASPTSKETLPWPALKKLRPSSLHRTASHLMREWERSLTPPVEEAEKDWIDKYIDDPRRSSTRDETTVSR